MKMKDKEVKIYTDGGSRGNPGQSACAYAICNMDGSVVEKVGHYLGLATNNQAEYQGLKRALERAGALGIQKAVVHMDSQLIVNQVNGSYKVKNRELLPIYEAVKTLIQGFEEVEMVYVPREQNQIADGEVNRILDKHQKS